MCGIICYNGLEQAKDLLINGLKLIEYRGYDSFGLAFLDENKFVIHKDIGTVSEYDKEILTDSTCGIGHVRWATYGASTKVNAHPHVGGRVALVHNGIVQNPDEIKTKHNHISQTDTEILAYYINDNIDNIEKAMDMVKGDFAIAFMIKNQEFIYLYCRNTPLYISSFNHGNVVASSANVFGSLSYQRIEDGKIIKIGKVCENAVRSNWTASDSNTIEEIKSQRDIGVPDNKIKLAKNKKLVIFGCGSSYNAARISKFLFVKAGYNVDVLFPDEVRFSSNVNYLGISQSGETKDVLKIAKLVHPYAITNMQHTTLESLSKKTIYLKCGPEVGVAATKTFTATLLALMSLAMPRKVNIIKNELCGVLSKIFGEYYPNIPSWIQDFENMYLLGNGIIHFCNIEGSLKLKEIALVHAEAIYLTELKHGPIALVDSVLSIMVVTKKEEAVMDTINQIKSKGGKLIILASEDLNFDGDHVIKMPNHGDLLNPFVIIIYLQLIAAEIGMLKNINIDRPKNLAKCITV